MNFFVIWTVTQGVFSRSNLFDHSFFQVVTVEEVARQLKPPGLWLNIQVIIKLHPILIDPSQYVNLRKVYFNKLAISQSQLMHF